MMIEMVIVRYDTLGSDYFAGKSLADVTYEYEGGITYALFEHPCPCPQCILGVWLVEREEASGVVSMRQASWVRDGLTTVRAW